ncbi:MAG: site-2 protease family protein [Phycisphaerae bacterium]|nr:site-2 protease family protein [Phycisphaerae bacterium]
MSSGWWVQSVYQNQGAAALFSWIFWVIFSICLHELAHGVVAIWNGDRTPRELGHMTLNPVVHMGLPSLLVFAVIGFAWGLMPTDPSRYRHYRQGVITVAAAGPAVNLILSGICIVGAGAWTWAMVGGAIQVDDNTRLNVFTFFISGGWLNVLLAVFNMLPVPPLDGSRVLGGIFPSLERFFALPGVQTYGMIVVLIIFFTSLARPLISGVMTQTYRTVGMVAHALPTPEELQYRGDALDSLYMVTSPHLQELLREHPEVLNDLDSVRWERSEAPSNAPSSNN